MTDNKRNITDRLQNALENNRIGEEIAKLISEIPVKLNNKETKECENFFLEKDCKNCNKRWNSNFCQVCAIELKQQLAQANVRIEELNECKRKDLNKPPKEREHCCNCTLPYENSQLTSQLQQKEKQIELIDRYLIEYHGITLNLDNFNLQAQSTIRKISEVK